MIFAVSAGGPDDDDLYPCLQLWPGVRRAADSLCGMEALTRVRIRRRERNITSTRKPGMSAVMIE